MKAQKCQCCGAPLPTLKGYSPYIKCEYCDATYQLTQDNQNFSITALPEQYLRLTNPGHIKRVEASIRIPNYELQYIPQEKKMEYIKKQLANQLTDYFEKNITVFEDMDIRNSETVFKTYIQIDTRKFS